MKRHFICMIILAVAANAFEGILYQNTFTEWNIKTGATSVRLNKRGIKAVHPNAFEVCTKLQELYLFDNELSGIEGRPFNSLAGSLITLDLSRNQLGFIGGDVFNSLLNLKSLHLHRNQLSWLNATLFSQLKSLQVLYLHENFITHIDSSQFNRLSNLQNLYLSNNRLTHIEVGTLSGLSQLVWLYLNGNLLGSIDSTLLQGLVSLKELYLYDNRIVQLEPDAFKDLAELRILDLNKNQLSYLLKSTLSRLTKLRGLGLEANNLLFLNQIKSNLANLSSLVNICLKNNPVSALKLNQLNELCRMSQNCVLKLNNSCLSIVCSRPERNCMTFSDIWSLR